VRAFVATIGNAEGKWRVLNEIRACAHAHMAERLELSWSPRGLRSWIIREIGGARIDSAIARLTTELAGTPAKGVSYRLLSQARFGAGLAGATRQESRG